MNEYSLDRTQTACYSAEEFKLSIFFTSIAIIMSDALKNACFIGCYKNIFMSITHLPPHPHISLLIGMDIEKQSKRKLHMSHKWNNDAHSIVVFHNHLFFFSFLHLPHHFFSSTSSLIQMLRQHLDLYLVHNVMYSDPSCDSFVE